MCAFINQRYIEEAKVCIQSLRRNGSFTGPIYLFTDMDVSIEGVIIVKMKCKSVPLSACYRTRLFEYIKDISSDDIFLYLDTDIVILKTLPSFQSIGDKICVYGYPSRTQNENSFSGFITKDVYYTSKPSICTGILIFRPSERVKKVFDDTYELYMNLLNQKKVNPCWEQPALCFTLIKENMYDITLTGCVYEERSKTKITDTHIFNHFCGLRSNVRNINMKKYITDL